MLMEGRERVMVFCTYFFYFLVLVGCYRKVAVEREGGGRRRAWYTSMTMSSTRFLNSSSLLSEVVVAVELELVGGGRWWFILALAALDNFSRMKRMSSGDWTSIFRMRFGSITVFFVLRNRCQKNFGDPFFFFSPLEICGGLWRGEGWKTR